MEAAVGARLEELGAVGAKNVMEQVLVTDRRNYNLGSKVDEAGSAKALDDRWPMFGRNREDDAEEYDRKDKSRPWSAKVPGSFCGSSRGRGRRLRAYCELRARNLGWHA